MTPALLPDALYTKSQVYIRRGLRAQGAGDTEEYQLWSSLSLELLGKAVLARVHPALIADPQHQDSMFAACGRPISPDVRTIPAKTLFLRLAQLDKSFDARHQKFCEQIAVRRNAELHSGESPFSGMNAELWEREFWGAISVLLSIEEQTLEMWLGAEDAKAPTAIVAQAKEARKWAVADRIRRAGDEFREKYKDPAQRTKAIDKAADFRWWEQKGILNIVPDNDSRHVCPSCTAGALLLGNVWHEEVVDTDSTEEGVLEIVEKLFNVEEFYCPACKLHLFGIDEIAAAELPGEFTKQESRDREFQQEYMNE